MPSRPDDADPPHPHRVWLVNHYADAPDRANGTRHFDLGRRLVERGDEVTILASGFSHVTGREERLRPGRLYGIQEFDGVRFVWLRTFPYRGNNWRRQVNMLSFVVALLVVQARLARPDAIVGSTVHPFAAFGAWLTSRLRRSAFLFEVRDLWPQTLVDLGVMRVGSPGERLLRRLEAFLVRRASIVITVLPGMRDYLAERGLPEDDVRYIPNGVDLAAFDRAAATPRDGLPASVTACLAAVDRQRAEGRLVTAYVGALGRVNEVDAIIEAVRIAEDRMPGRVGLLVIGDGPERLALEDLARGSSAVTILAPIPKWTIPVVLEAIDVGIVHVTANPVYRYGISFNKLFEYLAARRPVIFACESAYDPVATSGAGVSLLPNDPAGLADALLDVVDRSADERMQWGAAGRGLVERDHDIARLADELRNAIATAEAG